MKTQLTKLSKGLLHARTLSALMIYATIALTGNAAAQEIRATVDGNLVNFPDVQPMMTNGRVLVPVRGVFEHMNANVEWDSSSRVVHAQRGDDSIRLEIGMRYATLNGREVTLDTPATFYRGRTMVPLRFLSESLGASVDWVSATRTVEINTIGVANVPPAPTDSAMTRLDAGTVIPFHLVNRLTSDRSKRGDRFTAKLDTGNRSSYQGMNTGAILEGHVDYVKAKSGKTPGVLGLAFDRVRTSDGKTYPINGTLIGLDSKSVKHENGRIVAVPGRANDNLKYVGYGAGGGALVAILTKGNLVTNSLIGSALGFLYGESQKSPEKSRNVSVDAGTNFGVKLTRDFSFRAEIDDDQDNTPSNFGQRNNVDNDSENGVNRVNNSFTNDDGQAERNSNQRVQTVFTMTPVHQSFYNTQRKLWEDHAMWTRQFMISSANDLSNKDATSNRLFQNQVDIGSALKPVFGNTAGNQLSALLKEHVEIIVEIIQCTKNGDDDGANAQIRKGYDNGSEIADFLSSSNSRLWASRKMQEMMKTHLDLTVSEIRYELKGDYTASVRKYEQVRTHNLMMADMISSGIISQYPTRIR